jgi:para-nitrobenzyl esterase
MTPGYSGLTRMRAAPTWRYWFSHVHSGLAGQLKGVAHGGEVPYVMGTLQRCACLGTEPQAADEAVARRVGDRWAAFASTGSPQLTPADWPADTRWKPVVLDIGATDRIEPRFMQTRLNTFIGALNLVPRPGQ